MKCKKKKSKMPFPDRNAKIKTERTNRTEKQMKNKKLSEKKKRKEKNRILFFFYLNGKVQINKLGV